MDLTNIWKTHTHSNVGKCDKEINLRKRNWGKGFMLNGYEKKNGQNKIGW